ncbi:MAG: DUF6807 family protein [Verrucomicrobiota bacterium]
MIPPRFRTRLQSCFVISGLMLAQEIATTCAADELVVPPAEGMLQVTVPVTSQSLSSGRLVEDPGAAEPIAFDLVPGWGRDGLPSATARRLVASIPSKSGAQGPRRFRALEAVKAVSGPGSDFRYEPVSGQSLGLWEGRKPVFVYNHGVLTRPGVPEDRYRSTYVHPIYGIDGEVLTDDFPKDHYHHRGLFWAWPHVKVAESNYDLWDLRGIEQRFERWLDRRCGSAAAILGVENGWYVGGRKVAHERVWLTVFPAGSTGRVIDVDLTWVPTSQSITLLGAEEKSYGGFTLRYAPRTGTIITTPRGSSPEDLAVTRLPWADLSARFEGAPRESGAAVFISPDHPDYPPTWLTRHYGVLCVGWPGVKAATFQPGEEIRCSYRVWIHRDRPGVDELTGMNRLYQSGRQAHWAAADQ